jgi:DNA modification methylase
MNTSAQLAVVYWSIDKLKPYIRNPRKNDAAVDRMQASIQEFGFTIPVLARSSGEVIDGHLRLKAAWKLAISQIPVIVCDGWTDAQVKAFRLLVNRSVTWADWDADALALEFAELKAMDYDLNLTGFDSREIDAFTLQPNAAEDDAPPVPENPITKPGDLWLLGEHRLLCGDSTNADNVARLLGGRKADMVFTDPPYGVNFSGAKYNPRAKSWAGIQNDEKQGVDLKDFSLKWAANILLYSQPASPVYCWSAPMRSGYQILDALIEAGVHIQSQIVWVKNCIVMGQADYQWKHEVCWYGYTPGKHHYWAGGRSLSTVWEYSKDSKQSYVHPMQKPVCLSENAIKNSCREDGLVLDLFCGSGSTLIGTEKAARTGCFMEISPAYCDVIVKRWETLTGKTATLEAQ